MLWHCLEVFTDEIRSALTSQEESGKSMDEIADDPTFVFHDFPKVTRRQPIEWWEQIVKAGERLTDAARIGGDDLVPRTVAEEAMLILAPRSNADVFFDIHGEPDANRTQHGENQRNDWLSLPEDPEGDEYEWEEVLGSLTGDTDILMLWTPEMDGVGDPENETNRWMGMGDYRVSSWHRLFDRALPD